MRHLNYTTSSEAAGKEDTRVESRIETQYGQHPAETITLIPETTNDASSIHAFTDGSKSAKGVGTGIAIYKSIVLIKSLRYKLNNSCTNNQAEELAILKALQHIQKSRQPQYTRTAVSHWTPSETAVYTQLS